jgi:ketosteroid isomerase-like protein
MTQEPIVDLGRRWADAERRTDAAALDGLLAEDFTAIGPLGFVLDRRQYLEPRRSGVLRIDAFSWDDVAVRLYGTVAVATGVVTQHASYGGQDASGRFRVTQIAVQRAGSWLLAGIQYSGPMPDGPPGRG